MHSPLSNVPGTPPAAPRAPRTPPKSSAAPMSADLQALPGAARDHQLVTDELILSTLSAEEQRKEYKPQDFRKIRSLSLSRKNLCIISNLGGLSNLRRLVLSNNAIERITGLENLHSLESLDLSFNRITAIEGLSSLHRLVELDLGHNLIASVEPLAQMSQAVQQLTGVPEEFHRLQILNLSHNSIRGLPQTIQTLRTFRDLRALSLEHNPCAEVSTYRPQTVAYLPSLRYLDFRVILKGERASSAEIYRMELISLEEHDALEAANRQKAAAKATQLRIDSAADCLGLDTMVDREFLDTEQSERVFLIPAVKLEALGKFRTQCSQILRDASRMLRRRRILRMGELAEYEEAYDATVRSFMARCSAALEAFSYRRAAIVAACAPPPGTAGRTSAHAVQRGRQLLGDEIAKLKKTLLGLEAEVSADINEMTDQVVANLTSITGKTSELAQTALTRVRELLGQLNDTTQSLLQRALEARLVKESGGYVGGAPGAEDGDAAGMGARTIADGADTTQGVSSAIPGGGDAGAFGHVEVQNLLPAEMTPEVLALLKDRGTITSAAVAANESRMGAVDQQEDSIIAYQKEWLDNSTKIIQAAEAERNRAHLQQISQICSMEEQWADAWVRSMTERKK